MKFSTSTEINSHPILSMKSLKYGKIVFCTFWQYIEHDKVFHCNVSQVETLNLNQMLHSDVFQPKTNVNSLMWCPPIFINIIANNEIIVFFYFLLKSIPHRIFFRIIVSNCANEKKCSIEFSALVSDMAPYMDSCTTYQ